MSSISCPFSGSTVGKSGTRMGPRGCAFAAFQPNCLSIASSHGYGDVTVLHERERKAMNEILVPEPPAPQVTKGLKNADHLNPPDDEVLAAALGAPARRILNRAEEIGPRTGWKDGYLSSTHGFCPPDPSESPVALRSSPGRVWSDLCERMPGVVARGNVRSSILAVPLVFGTPDVIPDRALWAATTCLGILASVYRYEEQNDGSDGIAFSAPAGSFKDIAGNQDDEEEETKGIPRNIAIPLRQVCTRMGRILPHLTQFDVSIYNYKIRDPTSVRPYVARCENMDLRWPVFNDRGEAMFLLCMAEVHGCFVDGVELLARCQEAVMNRDNETLLQEMIALKSIIDQLPYIFHKISVNPNSGENFANPVEWGQRYAKFSAPLSKRVPALSGLALPLFLTMDAFLGRTKYDSFLGIEAVHLRRWLPLNIRAFIAALETYYKVPEYIKASGDPRLEGVLEGLVESYAGERGFMGTHRYKVYGFLEVVAKTGRTETNGNAGSGDTEGRAWEEVHKTLSESMRERLDPYHGQLSIQPHEMRGSFEECRFKAQIVDRQIIDHDPARSTAMVTIDLQNTGITFQPGDRLAVMPVNSASEISKLVAALGLESHLDEIVPVEPGSEWARFAKNLQRITKQNTNGLTVRDILRRGHLSPLTRDFMVEIHSTLRASSPTTIKLLASSEWPIRGSIGDLLQKCVTEVSPTTWDHAFSLDNISWLAKLISIEVPRTYSISNFSQELLPSMIDLTVSRTEAACSPLLRQPSSSGVTYGVSSGFLNPNPQSNDFSCGDTQDVLIGISRPINFQLPPSTAVPICMFAGGSGIAPFRGFWQSRIQNGIGRNILFLGVQSREKFLYEDELRGLVREGALELHLAFSRDRRGLVYDPNARDLVERDMDPRYIDAAALEQGKMVSELVMSSSQGGLGGYIFICGSTSVFETVLSGIHKAIYKFQAATKETAESLLATAFAERRFMLDIFMSPRPISYAEPRISYSKLAMNTGHRKGTRMWIGVHGAVYDVTDFLDVHPGGTLIVAASAGLDATQTFDDLAHSSNPEVSSLLSKYFIGNLATKPDFRSQDISQIYDIWYQYLRTSVESLTTLYFEASNIQQDSKVWFSGGLFNIGGVRKFYQFQSRLIQNGFSALFGAKLQEINLRLAFALAGSNVSGIQLPDIVGTVTRAHSSSDAASVLKQISEIGQFVCNNSRTAQFHENGILRYAQAVTEIDICFLEQIREEICMGMDAFDSLASMEESTTAKLVKLSLFLLTVLDRISQRLVHYYSRLARESIYRADLEKNPARTRWQILRRKIFDGTFFVLARAPDFVSVNNSSQLNARGTNYGSKIEFETILSGAQRFIDAHLPAQDTAEPRKSEGTQRLAHKHAARAAGRTDAPSTFESHEQQQSLNRMSTFIGKNLQAMRRLSRMGGMQMGGMQQNMLPTIKLSPTFNGRLTEGAGNYASPKQQMVSIPAVGLNHRSRTDELEKVPEFKDHSIKRSQDLSVDQARLHHRQYASIYSLPASPSPRFSQAVSGITSLSVRSYGSQNNLAQRRGFN